MQMLDGMAAQLGVEKQSAKRLKRNGELSRNSHKEKRERNYPRRVLACEPASLGLISRSECV
jgi:hypothetical protein